MLQVKNHLMGLAGLLDKVQITGQSHLPKIKLEIELLEEEVTAFGGWDKVTSLKVVGKNYTFPATQDDDERILGYPPVGWEDDYNREQLQGVPVEALETQFNLRPGGRRRRVRVDTRLLNN